MDPFWQLITPAYECFLRFFYRRGLKRCINDTDTMIIPHKYRYFTEQYEPKFWKMVMNDVHKGDVIADIGAYIGFYAVAFAKRTGRAGKVVAFEPDPSNFSALRENISLNKVETRIELVNLAVADKKGQIKFSAEGNSISSVAPDNKPNAGKQIKVETVALDEYFENRKVDIIKIDVEGYELQVLRGAKNILQRRDSAPRAVFIEVHPYAWDNFGSTDKEIVSLLTEAGYKIIDVDGNSIGEIKNYEQVIAVKMIFPQKSGHDE